MRCKTAMCVDGELSESFIAHRDSPLPVTFKGQSSNNGTSIASCMRRNIIYLNDLYSDEDVRFKDSQRPAMPISTCTITRRGCAMRYAATC